ncbi:DUF2564 family protein [Priestia endophytica]|uniref:DUF2564 family protein n=1 Tax=Priestia endophytica TaxID=135735 RepID=UPI000DCA44BA|nr:DUF2564 family protein [Priestia endophytica]RAS74208.1 cytosolic protein [Priestia endophytica]
MEHFSNDNITTGYNDLGATNAAVEATKNIVGAATRNMDPERLREATEALSSAKAQLESARNNATGVDEAFLQRCEETLQKCEQQLNAAKI